MKKTTEKKQKERTALRAQNRAPQDVLSTPHKLGSRKGKENVSGKRWTVDWRFHKDERHVGWKFICEVKPDMKLLVLNQYLG